MESAPASPSNLPQTAPRLWKRWGIEAMLAGFVALLFAPTLRYGFVYDDRVVILENPYIQSWRWFLHDFTSHVWAQVSSQPASYYRPVFITWLRLNHTLFGFQPWGWHLTTVLAHVVATLLVYRLALRLLRSPWQAAIAALIFAVHPVHVENVAWVCGSVDPLMSIFYLGAILSYLRWREQHSPVALAVSVLLALTATLTKEIAITLPAVIFAYAALFSPAEAGWGKRFLAAARDTVPFVLVAAAYMAARSVVLHGPIFAEISLATVLLTLPGLLLFYARLTVWPVNLSLFYNRAPVQSFSAQRVLLPLLVLALIAAGLFMWLRRSKQRREGLFALVLALLALSPPLYIRLFNPDDFVHDRYLYLSMAGVAMLAAMAITSIRGVKDGKSFAPLPQVLVVAAITLALSLGTTMTNGNWRDDLSLWGHCFKVAPHNVRVLNNLASSLGESGAYQVAVPMFLEVLKRDPSNARANANLGYTLYQAGALEQAEKYLSKAVLLNASDAHSWLYLGVTHLKLGATAEAESDLRQAITIDPSATGAHLALSVVLEQRGDRAGAIAESQEELRYHPEEQSVQQRLQQLQAK
ncbi:tetratricopeptide repeat protein [Candidatus Korobacter versatilis]|nr:tetratricopeptide repeat protein [Candidatus Koribacter versatilis]